MTDPQKNEERSLQVCVTSTGPARWIVLVWDEATGAAVITARIAGVSRSTAVRRAHALARRLCC